MSLAGSHGELGWTLENLVDLFRLFIGSDCRTSILLTTYCAALNTANMWNRVHYTTFQTLVWYIVVTWPHYIACYLMIAWLFSVFNPILRKNWCQNQMMNQERDDQNRNDSNGLLHKWKVKCFISYTSPRLHLFKQKCRRLKKILWNLNIKCVTRNRDTFYQDSWKEMNKTTAFIRFFCNNWNNLTVILH